MSVFDSRLKYQLRNAGYEAGRRQVSPRMLLLAGMLLTGLVGAINGGAYRRVADYATPVPASLEAPSVDARAEKPLSASMSLALDSVAQRYRVSPAALQPIFVAAQQAAKDLDPLLIVAIIGIESGFNPFAQSVMGAQGLMQVIPRFHRDKLPPDAAASGLLDPVSNVKVGAQVLREAIRRQGGLIEGLQYYAGASDDPDRGYSSRVIAEKQRLEQAIRARKPNLAMVVESQKAAREAPPKTN